MYSHHSGPLSLCLKSHITGHAACRRPRSEEREKEGWGRHLLCICCIVTVCGACPAAFLNLCISTCTSPSPFAFCSLCYHSPPAPLPVLPSAGHSALHRPLDHHHWMCPADGAKTVGRAGGQEAWKKEKWCLTS